MRVALVAPPFIPIPPHNYGGTELFIAQLAIGLKAAGIDVVVYANGESTVPVEVRSFYAKSDWPPKDQTFGILKDLNHSAWAVRDAVGTCDVIHLNSAPGLVHARFVDKPFVYTVHHAKEDELLDFYRFYSPVNFVTISEYQRIQQRIVNSRTIYHGVDVNTFAFDPTRKREYLSFLGRIAPVKGTHLAIEVAQKTGIPLKIAGQVQPAFQNYFDTKVKPHIDGRLIEYLGEADHAVKNELLAGSLAMLFPIQWHEPFGLVLVEAMACGAPVIALDGGSVPEIVRDGVSGFVCSSVDEMIAAVRKLPLPAQTVREYVAENFSTEKMVSGYVDLYRSICASPTRLESAVA